MAAAAATMIITISGPTPGAGDDVTYGTEKIRPHRPAVQHTPRAIIISHILFLSANSARLLGGVRVISM